MYEYSRSTKMLLIATALMIIVGTAFIIVRVQEQPGIETNSRPETHLTPYPYNTTDLDFVFTGENIEIRVEYLFLTTMSPHVGPTTMECAVTLEVENTSNETINDFRGEMGTVFDEENEALYSFWIDMLIDNQPVTTVSLPPHSIITIRCDDRWSFTVPTGEYTSYDLAYIRLKLKYNSNYTAIITTNLGDILHAIE